MRTACIVSVMLIANMAAADAVQGERLRFENGRWFDGTQFRTATVEVENGLLDFDPPRRMQAQTKTFDLSGGIFYVKVLTNVPYYTGRMRHLLGGSGGVDAAFANQGITGGGGHPILTRELLWKAGAYPGVSKEWLKDNTYFVADTDADVERFWPAAAASDG